MTVGRIFIFDENPGQIITVSGSDMHHIKNVLRMKLGDTIIVCNSQGNEYRTTITEMNSNIKLNVEEINKTNSELPVCVTLYQAFPKGDKMDIIIQKCTELGINRIVPVMSDRCVVKLDSKSVENKKARFIRIAESAAKQSGRSIIPEVTLPVTFGQAISEIKTANLGFVCYEGEVTTQLHNVLTGFKSTGFELNPFDKKSIAFFIGPEGGLSLDEADTAKNSGLIITGLGKRILRTETAPIFVMSAISFMFQ
ncbi:MAG: hypothetical protein A2Y17_11630 [Clostridiales bacterium GWF2_38_85]|nr:MAG: hypothetical protein A2Y17_11630 [Clostridiales bacterium GWF2_38_85]HBL85352.1 16S rRNA (uracil(1498)-N(3))-methyltransferase [Clostridiales bacterium]